MKMVKVLMRFLLFIEDKAILATLGTLPNCTKCLEILLLLYNLHIFVSNKKRNFLVFLEQLFEKLWATFWEILGNLWKALLKSIPKPPRYITKLQRIRRESSDYICDECRRWQQVCAVAILLKRWSKQTSAQFTCWLYGKPQNCGLHKNAILRSVKRK